MIEETQIKESWNIYSAQDLHRKFNLDETWDEIETDEDYIMRHLNADSRLFRVTFFPDEQDPYEEYWKVEEIQK